MGCQLETKFWNDKILDWEKKRYFSNNFGGKALKKRMDFAEKICKEHRFRRILELGCGSGVFYTKISKNLISYTGVDISDTAISAFRKKSELNNGKLFFSSLGRFNKERQNSAYDLVVSLGTIDWLAKSELEAFRKLNDGHQFLHSFSQKRSILRLLHYIYTFVTYGRKNSAYMAKYYSNREIADILGEKQRDLKFIKITSLVYFVTNIDFREKS